MHGVTPAEAEFVVEHPERGFPEDAGDEKLRVRGQSLEGRYLQVVYLLDSTGVVYVIHARDLTDREKRNLRRRRGR